MAKVLIGNFKGPKGDKGDTGEGKTGPAGAAGQRGSRWSEGTAITGTSTTATVFSGTGIADALANDMYMNTSTGNVYRCTVGGAAAVAKWVFAGNLKGTKGDKGNTGAKGATGLKALQPNRRWTSTFTTVGATASAPFTDFNRNPVVGDVFMNADGNSNIGQWKITAISGTTATFQLISYVSAKGAKGDTGASGTADTTFTEAATLTKLASGESFKAMLGKIAKAVSTIFDKFDKKNIVNNQTTTVAGFALDARQANPNIDGTLAKQLSDLNGSINRYPSKLSQCYATDNESHTFPIDALSLFFITYGNNDQADVYLCRCVSVNAHALVPLHTSSVIAQTYEIKLDVATRSVTITSKRSWAQVDVINI